MCEIHSRRCLGLDNGPLIVDMTQIARHGMQKRTKKPPPPSSVSKVYTKHQASFDRMSQQAMVTEAFFGRFLVYFASEGEAKDIRNKASWLQRLPKLCVDGSNEALALAVQATASSYCAMETLNLALTRHAWDLYGQAIQAHSRYVARSQTKITLHVVSTSMLFSFFEAMQATNADAYRSHVYGAAKMFEIISPRECYEGVLCELFFHVRTQLCYVRLAANGRKPLVDLNVKRILEGTLDYEQLPIFQRVMTNLTRLVDACSDNELSSGGDDENVLVNRQVYQSIEVEVDALWQEYSDTALLDNELLMWYDASADTTQYRDTFTALVTAYFSAIRVLLCVTALKATGLRSSFAYHCRSILQAALYMQTRSNGLAYMRMAAPLLLVALHAPQLEQRMSAITCFESWEGGSMRGISDLALEAIHDKYSSTK
jgi:hypothetical protein